MKKTIRYFIKEEQYKGSTTYWITINYYYSNAIGNITPLEFLKLLKQETGDHSWHFYGCFMDVITFGTKNKPKEYYIDLEIPFAIDGTSDKEKHENDLQEEYDENKRKILNKLCLKT